MATPHHSPLAGGMKSHSDFDHEMHVLLLSKSRVKSSLGTSTLLAGFALVSGCYSVVQVYTFILWGIAA